MLTNLARLLPILSNSRKLDPKDSAYQVIASLINNAQTTEITIESIRAGGSLGSLIAVLTYGTAAERAVFVPLAATGLLTVYYETDNNALYTFNATTGWNVSSGGIDQLTGDVTAGPGSGSQVATIANDAVTYAKMQNVSAASRLLGRGSAGGAGDVEELTVGSGLSFAGTVLSASGSGAADPFPQIMLLMGI